MKQKIILQLYGIYIRDINEDISEAADVIDKYATSLDIKIGESVLFQTKRSDYCNFLHFLFIYALISKLFFKFIHQKLKQRTDKIFHRVICINSTR